MPGYSRVHIISLDATRSEYQTYVKAGATALVLKLLELQRIGGDSLLPDLGYDLQATIADLKAISRSVADWDRPVEAARKEWHLDGVGVGRERQALGIQRLYLQAANDALKGKLADPDFDQVLTCWGELIDSLEGDLSLAENRIDWLQKRRVLKAYQAEEQVSWTSDELRAQELEYCRVAPKGAWSGVEVTDRFLSEEQILQACTTPPPGRATARAAILALHNKHRANGGEMGLELEWDRVGFYGANGITCIERPMPDPHSEYPELLEELGKTLQPPHRDRRR
jgi:hypothetical protein